MTDWALLLLVLLGLLCSAGGLNYNLGALRETSVCSGSENRVSHNCGYIPKVNFKSNIALTSFGELPWHVVLFNRRTNEYICSGVLITEVYVLSARECVRNVDANLIDIIAGDWDLYNEDNPEEAYRSARIPVKRMFKHDKNAAFDRRTQTVYLELMVPIDYNMYPQISPACISRSPNLVLESLEDCFVAGWNLANLQGDDYGRWILWNDDRARNYFGYRTCPSDPNVPILMAEHRFRPLLKVTVAINSHARCSRTTDVSHYSFCAYVHDPEMSCRVDRGSPVICNVTEQPTSNRPSLAHRIRERPDIMCSSRWQIVGIITSVHLCRGNQKTQGALIGENIKKFTELMC